MLKPKTQNNIDVSKLPYDEVYDNILNFSNQTRNL